MSNLSTIDFLINELPEHSWPWVISALRKDQVVWNKLENPNFLKLAIRKIGSTPARWTPLNLSILDIDNKAIITDQVNPNELYPYLEKNKDQITKAIKYKSLSSQISLSTSGLLAVYFHQQPDLFNRISWKTTSACLLSLVREPLKFLSKINPEMAVHSILSNPLPNDSAIDMVINLLLSYSAEDRFKAINYLGIHNPEMAKKISGEILSNYPQIFEGIDLQNFNKTSIDQIAEKLKEIGILSLTNQVKDQSSKIISTLENLQELQASESTTLICSLISQKEINQARRFWGKNNLMLNPDQMAKIILNLETHGFGKEIINWVEDIEFWNKEPTGSHGQRLAFGLISFYKGNKNYAMTISVELAEESLQSFLNLGPQQLPLAKLLNKLDRHELAIKLLSLKLAEQPNDLKTLNLLSDCYNSDSNHVSAAKISKIPTILFPNLIESREKYANNLEKANLWSEALLEREKIITSQSIPEKEDLYRLAWCAIRANQPQRSASICKQILTNEPHDAFAHMLLGEAYRSLGDPTKAISHFQRSVDTSPNLTQAWLGLSDTYKNLKNDNKAIETLRAGSIINPKNPEILLALGREFYEANELTKAFELLQRAYVEIIAKEGKIAKRVRSTIAQFLGNTLRKLGHLKKSLDILKATYPMDTDHVGLSHAFAKTLIALDETYQAKQILENVLPSGPDDFDLHLDYVKTCLSIHEDLDKAKDSLRKILITDPEHTKAKTLFAETLEANHEFDLAFSAFKDALNSLPEHEYKRHKRLSLGLGRVSLFLNDPETAIAVLEDLFVGEKGEPETLKILSSAYQLANLNDKALAAAKSVVTHKPLSDENLDWFINQTNKLKETSFAINAVKTLLNLEKPQANLLNRLGWLYISESDLDSAKDSFYLVKSVENVDAQDLITASKGLIEIGESHKALECLDHAISLSSISDDITSLANLYSEKASCFKEMKRLEDALETINQAIHLNNNLPSLISLKVILLQELNRFKDALITLETGINNFPKNIQLRDLAVKIYRETGKFSTALNHVLYVINLYQNREFQYQCSTSEKVNFADLACVLLESEMARTILKLGENTHKGENSLEDLSYYCLMAELALDRDEEILAADALTSAIKIDPNHPQVLAIQARITALNGDSKSGEQLLKQALGLVGFSENSSNPESQTLIKRQTTITYNSLAETCLYFNQWSPAIFLFNKVIQIAPDEPSSHFNLARALCLRAEYQRLCHTLDVIVNAPGEFSTAEFAFLQFKNSIMLSTKIIKDHALPDITTHGHLNQSKSKLDYWLSRGKAIFQPSPHHSYALKEKGLTEKNISPYLASLRYSGKAQQAASLAIKELEKISRQPIDTLLLAQIALVLLKNNPDLALQAIQIAIDTGTWLKLNNLPIYYAIRSYIAQRKNDRELQHEAIRSAIQGWPNEPRWLTYAAKILISEGSNISINNAIEYLETAIKIEPKRLKNHLILSNAYQKLCHLPAAIKTLEKATSLVPEQSKVWYELSSLYHLSGDIPQTIRCAKKAIDFESKSIEPLILLAQVSIEVKNPEMALKYISEILKISADHSQALLLKTKAHQALEQHALALESLEEALLFTPTTLQLELDRVKLIKKTRGIKPAIQRLMTLNEEQPQNPRILSALAEELALAGDNEAAINIAQQALKEHQGKLDEHDQSYFTYLLGRLLRKSGHLDQAIKRLTDAVRLSPEYANPHIELGRCYQERRQYDQAIYHFDKAVEINPDDSDAHYFSGLVYKSIKDFKKAEVQFKKASLLSPDNISIHRQLAAVTAINIVQAS